MKHSHSISDLRYILIHITHPHLMTFTLVNSLVKQMIVRECQLVIIVPMRDTIVLFFLHFIRQFIENGGLYFPPVKQCREIKQFGWFEIQAQLACRILHNKYRGLSARFFYDKRDRNVTAFGAVIGRLQRNLQSQRRTHSHFDHPELQTT